jgi:Pyruvate:ferredoxin oxidoreductase and related 2-oxoacid:ferredoxin oxidoreductases, gamma subunit
VTWSTTRRSPTPKLLTCSTALARCRAPCTPSTPWPPRSNLFGSTAAANFLLIGAAYQTGALRLPAESIEEAIELNGVAVKANVAAFRWGRVAIADPARFDDVVSPARDRQQHRRLHASLKAPRSPARSATSSHDGLRTSFSSKVRRSRADT